MTLANPSLSRSRLVAALLAGAWRSRPSAASCSTQELEWIAPLLTETGGAALAWRRLRHSELAEISTAQQLHDAYRLYQLLSVVYEREVLEALRLLRSHGIEPVMVKGWAVARNYAEPETRPCGDIDLCVSREQYTKALGLLKGRNESAAHHVDLHEGFRKLDDGSFEELSERSELVELEGVPVRVLCAEDHLRVLCYHFLREGGWRPLWLCDISAALEARTTAFNWDLCLLRGRRPVAGWVACALRLAHQLLGADLTDAPAAVREARLPQWLVESILREWEVRSMRRRHMTPMAGAMSHPFRALKGLRHHWPTPVEATVTLGGSFNQWPRLPFQLGNFISRAAALLLARPAARARH